jgi:hypothetical protein
LCFLSQSVSNMSVSSRYAHTVMMHTL